jgi:hypothetical protein
MKPNEFNVVRARCNRYFTKDKQWFNQGNEYIPLFITKQNLVKGERKFQWPMATALYQ